MIQSRLTWPGVPFRLGRASADRTAFPKAYFKDLAAGDGALWAWDATTNKIDELRAR